VLRLRIKGNHLMDLFGDLGADWEAIISLAVSTVIGKS
jgi:hypothetical protein